LFAAAKTDAACSPIFDAPISPYRIEELPEARVSVASVLRATQRGLEFGISWSRSRPTVTDVPAHVTITPDSLPVIEEAGRLLREISPREEFELQGIVVALERGPGAESGKVTVLAFVDGRPHAVKIELGARDYDLALRAHEMTKPISALGDLVKEGRSYFLRQARGLRVFEPDQDNLL